VKNLNLWWVVKGYAKAGIGRKAGHKMRAFSCKFSVKLPRKRDFLAVQDDFGEIIDVVQR